MGTTITAAPLRVTITEAITINGQDKGSTNILSIPLVTEVSQRIITVGTSETIILAFGTAVGSETFNEADVRYIRITNIDSTNHCTLIFRSENSAECAHKIDAGHSLIIPGDNSGGVVDVHDASSSSPITVSFDDLVDITAQFDTLAGDLELFVAGE